MISVKLFFFAAVFVAALIPLVVGFVLYFVLRPRPASGMDGPIEDYKK
jgi:hypothetical protein